MCVLLERDHKGPELERMWCCVRRFFMVWRCIRCDWCHIIYMVFWNHHVMNMWSKCICFLGHIFTMPYRPRAWLKGKRLTRREELDSNGSSPTQRHESTTIGQEPDSLEGAQLKEKSPTQRGPKVTIGYESDSLGPLLTGKSPTERQELDSLIKSLTKMIATGQLPVMIVFKRPN